MNEREKPFVLNKSCEEVDTGLKRHDCGLTYTFYAASS